MKKIAFPLIYSLAISLIIFLIYSKNYPLGLPGSGQWLWPKHPWTGFFIPAGYLIISLIILSFAFHYLIKKSAPSWLILVLSSLLLLALIFSIFNINIWWHAIQYHGDMAYYVLARSQIYQGDYLELSRRFLEGIGADRFPGYAFNVLFSNTGTHPPGPIIFYQLIEDGLLQLKTLFFPRLPISFEPSMVAVIKAILNLVSIIPIYLIGQTIAGKRVGLYAAIFFILSPAMIFFMLFPDTFNLFFFATGFWFLIYSEKNFWCILPSALVFALATFMSFGYFSLYLLAGIWLLIRLVQKAVSLKAVIWSGVIYLTVLVVWYLVAKYLLGYDYILGWIFAQSAHHVMTGNRNLVDWYWLNLLDVLQFAGYPACLLALAALSKIKNKKLPTQEKAIIIIAPLAFIVINSLGLARGEAGRIWVFAYPLIFIAAAISIKWFRSYVDELFILSFIFSLLLTLVMRGSFYTFSIPPGYY